MKLFAAILIVLALASGVDAQTCTHYASPTGTGNGLLQTTPFKITDFLALGSLPGKVLCLLNGTYTGNNSMIAPSSGLSGSSGSPITIRALNDGQVTIDGQGARTPLVFTNNDFFIVEGVNLKSSSADVAYLTSGSSNNIIRRVIVWNAADAGGSSNNHGIQIANNSNNNLLEDIGALGISRNNIIFSPGSSTISGNTCRRCWARWEGYSGSSGPEMAMQMAYNTNVSGSLFENFIATWTGERDTGASPGIPIIGWNIEGDLSGSTQNRAMGGIAYVKSGAVQAGGGISTSNGIAFAGVNASDNSNVTLQDIVVYVDPSFTGVPSLNLLNCNFDGAGGGCAGGSVITNAHITNATLIAPAAAIIGSEWTKTNVQEFTTVGAAQNIFTGTGAKVCNRYVDGTLTSTPLWPWPMDQRIKDALAAAGSSPLAGTAQTVTSEIESIFGAIPTACRTGGSGGGAQELVLQMGLDENTGTAPQDSSGKANHGSFGAGVTWTALGKYGKALVFDGTQGIVTVANSTSLQLVDGMTLEAWFYPTATHTDFRAGIVKDYVYYLYTSIAGYCGDGAVFGGIDPTGAVCYATPLPANTWTHVAITYDNTNVTLYLNGTLASSQASGQIPPSTGALTIGGSPFGEFFEGRIDEVRMYNYARSQAQIIADMNTPINALPSTPYLTVGASATWKFGAGTSAFKMQGQ